MREGACHERRRPLPQPRVPFVSTMIQAFPRRLYEADTAKAARRLLGCRLVREVDGERMAGIIVETEAYLGTEDLGCHSARGRTNRTEVMFGPPGHAYVYLIYGMYHCLNVVTRPEGDPQAVLIRAIEPVEGLEQMRRNRSRRQRKSSPVDRELANGPGKLCEALGIDGSFNGVDLAGKALRIELAPPVPDRDIATGPRIGIAYAGEWAQKPLRFWIRGNPCVSTKE